MLLKSSKFTPPPVISFDVQYGVEGGPQVGRADAVLSVLGASQPVDEKLDRIRRGPYKTEAPQVPHLLASDIV